MPRNKRNNRDGDSNGNWMTTYSDMVTLLLAFFVLLYSFSSVDAGKFDMLVRGLKGRLGVLDGGQTVSQAKLIESGLMGQGPGSMSMRGLYNVKAEVSEYIEEKNLEENISLSMDEEGLTIRFTGKVLFDLGEAVLKRDAYSVLDRIGEFIKGVENEVVVEGHTDNWPIDNSRYPSNWELSTSRATNVVRYLIEKKRINPDRLSAAGYSKYKPIHPNDTRQHRALNRRVDVVLKRKTVEEKDMITGEKEDIINE